MEGGEDEGVRNGGRVRNEGVRSGGRVRNREGYKEKMKEKDENLSKRWGKGGGGGERW